MASLAIRLMRDVADGSTVVNMNNVFADLSAQVAAAVERVSPAVVQVHGHRRPTAGVVFDADLVVAPSRALGEDTAVVRTASGTTIEGHVLGHASGTGLAIVRVSNLGATAVAAADEPKVGSLAIAVGRTWSGAVMATITNVAVVGGPLRTGRSSQMERVIRITQGPHGALSGGALVDGDGSVLGLLTGSEIRGTTVVIPAAIAREAARQVVQRGGTRRGYLGVGTIPVTLPERQRAGHDQDRGLLITAIVPDSPADRAGLLIGDVIVQFDKQAVQEPEVLLTLLRSDHVDKAVPLVVLRGVKRQELAVTIAERTRQRG